MATEVRRISIEALASNVEDTVKAVIRDRAAVVVETEEGELAIIKPMATRQQRPEVTEEDYQIFLSSAGSWKDIVDAEALKEGLAASRRLPARPLPDL